MVADLDPQETSGTWIAKKGGANFKGQCWSGSKYGEKVAIRIIDNRSNNVSLDKLGFSHQMLEAWKQVINQPNGVVLVTGPTGSGKSTTLYSVLNMINTEDLNISTVEDPVGTEVRRGREAILEFYGGLEGLEASTTLHQVKIAAGEAVFSFELVTKVGDKSYTVAPIDHMVFDEDGRITAMRAFWDPATDMSVS